MALSLCFLLLLVAVVVVVLLFSHSFVRLTHSEIIIRSCFFRKFHLPFPTFHRAIRSYSWVWVCVCVFLYFCIPVHMTQTNLNWIKATSKWNKTQRYRSVYTISGAHTHASIHVPYDSFLHIIYVLFSSFMNEEQCITHIMYFNVNVWCVRVRACTSLRMSFIFWVLIFLGFDTYIIRHSNWYTIFFEHKYHREIKLLCCMYSARTYILL